ncbi:MAG: hypothetical protein U1F43_20635 [Myxococcota bacterium]
MLMGAITAAVLGTLVFVVMLLRNSGRAQKVLRPLAAGDRGAARAALDRMVPARKRVSSPRETGPVRERWAGLAVLEDAATIQAELDALEGPESALMFAKNIGYLALTLVGPNAQASASALAALAADAEAKKLHRLSRATLRDQAAVAQALLGTPIGDKQLQSFRSGHLDGGLVEQLAKRCVERVRAAKPVAAAA